MNTKKFLLFPAVCLILLTGACSSKNNEKSVSACAEEFNCSDCDCLFDRMQADPGNYDLIQCYEKNCKK